MSATQDQPEPRSPIEARTAMDLGLAAMKAENWSEAIRLFDIANALNPKIDPAYTTRGAARLHLEEDAALRNARAPVAIERVENSEARDLLLKFESLGENCEFGLVQRRFEAEPLGFLRWTYASPAMLTKLLESHFAGIGEADSLKLVRATWGEYFLKDQIYGVTFHTYLSDCGPSEDLFVKKQSARLVWLKNKLLEDMQVGAKIFVYKVHYPCPDETMSRIASLMQGYGKNRLLCIRQAASGAAPRSVKAEQGMTTGYIERVEPGPSNTWNICYDDWLSVCRAVDQR